MDPGVVLGIISFCALMFILALAFVADKKREKYITEHTIEMLTADQICELVASSKNVKATQIKFRTSEYTFHGIRIVTEDFN